MGLIDLYTALLGKTVKTQVNEGLGSLLCTLSLRSEDYEVSPTTLSRKSVTKRKSAPDTHRQVLMFSCWT